MSSKKENKLKRYLHLMKNVTAQEQFLFLKCTSCDKPIFVILNL